MSKLLKVLVSLFLAVGVSFAADKNPSSPDAIKARGVLKVAVFSDKPPFGFVDAQGKNQGYDIFFVKRIAKELLGDENKVEYTLVEPAARVEILKSGRVDIVFANFTYTEERAKQVDFANPYFKTAIGVVSNDKNKITNVAQLKGKKLIVVRGTTADVYFSKNHKEIELVKYDQITEAFQALKDGRGVGFAQDNALLSAWALSNKGFSVGVGAVGDVEPIAPAVQKGNTELRDWINATFVKLGKEHFAHQAYEATLKPVYGDTIKPEDLIVEGGVL
ncbi:amino acid ABC transporter substrate-binding protein [Campylobacterota bacterium]|nr:amino acid ABC transporter substrate-binding protein [Campylobacterota bacterium]GHV08177.1 amino acid ABC transporter substrate-binding protein [Campylobacterota bacterium]